MIYVQKSYAPEIIPGKKPVRIAFENIFDYTLPFYVKEKNEASYHAGIVKLTEGLSASFSRDASFRFIIGDTLKKNIKAGQLTSYLPKDTIYAICNRHNADMLLTLDSLNIFFDWETIVTGTRGVDREKTKNFYLYLRLYLSFYSAAGEIINRSMVEKSSLYKSREALSVLITFAPSIAKAGETIKSLAFQAGEDYVSKFYPQTVQEQREIYTGKVFKESNLFIKLRNWDKAVEILDRLASSPDPKVASKARHNLLVVREAAASGK